MQRTDTIIFNYETANTAGGPAEVAPQPSIDQYPVPRPFNHTPEQRGHRMAIATRAYRTPEALKTHQISNLVSGARAQFEQSQRQEQLRNPEQVLYTPEQVREWMHWAQLAGYSLETMRRERQGDYGLAR